MPLCFANVGEDNIIQRVAGSQEVRQHLENMGFVPGTTVTLISSINNNVIVKVKESRVAISEEMARKIMIQ